MSRGLFFCDTVSRASLKMALRENGAQSFKIRSAKAALVHSEELLKLCDKLPKVPKRVCNLSFTVRDVVLSFNFAEIRMIVKQSITKLRSLCTAARLHVHRLILPVSFRL